MSDAVVVGSGRGAVLMADIIAKQNARLAKAERVVVVEPTTGGPARPPFEREGHQFGHAEQHFARIIIEVKGNRARIVKSSQREDVQPGDEWEIR